MNILDRELEQLFLKLPTLNHIGMALQQYTRSVTKVNVDKRMGIYFFGYAGFSFSPGSEAIRLHVNLELAKVNPADLRWLPLETGEEFLVCDITSPRQLAQATRYIGFAQEKFISASLLDSPFVRNIN
jgi:hypothetical protein